MKEFVIFGDSTCDLNKALREQYGIDYVPMNYVVDDQEYCDFIFPSLISIRLYFLNLNSSKLTTLQR